MKNKYTERRMYITPFFEYKKIKKEKTITKLNINI